MEDEEEIINSKEITEKSTKQIGVRSKNIEEEEKDSNFEEEQEAELTIDLYQTKSEVILQSMIAGVHPDNLSINITRDSVSIKGRREENRSIDKDDYVTQELYWGTFSRTVLLPEEIDPEEAEAIENHGLLTIKLPKIDKNKETKLKVKSI